MVRLVVLGARVQRVVFRVVCRRRGVQVRLVVHRVRGLRVVGCRRGLQVRLVVGRIRGLCLVGLIRGRGGGRRGFTTGLKRGRTYGGRTKIGIGLWMGLGLQIGFGLEIDLGL